MGIERQAALALAMLVEHRKVADRVIAISQPVVAAREKSGPLQGQPLFSE